MKKVIEFDHACRSCKSTGLYQGMGEDKGAAVVCADCKGTGKAHFRFEYEEFEGRKKAKDIERVFHSNPGIGIGTKGAGGVTYKLEDFGGISYEDWLKGKKFGPGTEMRHFTCPAWWYQSADYEKKPSWDECNGGAFRNCSSFPKKAQCWARWDKEFA